MYNLAAPDFTNPKNIRYPNYNGIVANGRLEIEKTREGKRGPMISLKGNILTINEGSKTAIKVSPAGWSALSVFLFLLLEFMLTYMVFAGEGKGITFWIPIVVGLFGYFLLIVFVKYETGIYRRILLKTLNGRLASKEE
ncbi:hypothetical protein [Mucilaginibacter celer]|uniref:hypothetical protein n=1 Tax=Mucilaginibacter celer TaxID=2305508 RepID=UPI0013CEA737|nr:hypothetical protein [Mucilaginibacter celer]